MSVSIAILFILIVYAIGVARFRHHARGTRPPPVMHMLAMGAAFLLIELALASPLDELADQLLSAHMVQHLLLMLAAAPLLVWARPLPYVVWSPPMPVRKAIAYVWNRAGISRLVRLLKTPAVSWIAFCGTVLLWHVPAIYRWAVGEELRHSLMHLSFLGSALLFWSVVLDSDRKRRLDYFACALFVLSAALVTGLPGALICFARQPLYMLTADASLHDGLTVLADQQLAGLIMWIPMDLSLFAVAITLFAVAIRTERAKGGTGPCNTIKRRGLDPMPRRGVSALGLNPAISDVHCFSQHRRHQDRDVRAHVHPVVQQKAICRVPGRSRQLPDEQPLRDARY